MWDNSVSFRISVENIHILIVLKEKTEFVENVY